jgi:hypothetical protein
MALEHLVHSRATAAALCPLPQSRHTENYTAIHREQTKLGSKSREGQSRAEYFANPPRLNLQLGESVAGVHRRRPRATRAAPRDL